MKEPIDPVSRQPDEQGDAVGAGRFKITVPHAADCRIHRWMAPNGWRGVGPVEVGYFPESFVLLCNDPKCPGRAVVPVSVLTDFADSQDPARKAAS